MNLYPITSFQGQHRWLSNFWPCRIDYGLMTFSCVEAAYQAFKCSNPDQMAEFVGLNGAESKQHGKSVNVREDWDSIKLDVMRWALYQKFAVQDLRGETTELAVALTLTGERELIEGNTWRDTFWGVCNGVGENHLGRLLTEVRSWLRPQILTLSDSYKPYAGIGSRETPPYVQLMMNHVGRELAKQSYTLRSGGADGADSAFQSGCQYGQGKLELYLPWSSFNGNSGITNIHPASHLIAGSVHPNWDACSDTVKKLHARNCAQVFGRSLNSPSKFVVCWTPGAAACGGTRTAIVLAETNGIPVFNMADERYCDTDKVLSAVNELEKIVTI
jgi:ribA/ribD-fused uncharacterized protein